MEGPSGARPGTNGRPFFGQLDCLKNGQRRFNAAGPGSLYRSDSLGKLRVPGTSDHHAAPQFLSTFLAVPGVWKRRWTPGRPLSQNALGSPPSGKLLPPVTSLGRIFSSSEAAFLLP